MTDAIVTTEKSQLAVSNPMIELAKRLPRKYQDAVMLLRRPETEELVKIVDSLPTDMRDKMIDLIRRTRPNKQGVHGGAVNFAPVQLRLNQGTGNDPLRPAKHIPGEFYTTESKGMETPFEAAVIGLYKGRTMWPPRQQGGKQDENQSKSPICYSLDRETGSRYGDCGTCPNAQKKYSEGGCMQEVTLFLVDRAMTNIYSLVFNKSSFYAGENLVKIITKSDEIWSRWIKFETQEREATINGQKVRFFVIKASPVVDAKTANTPRELYPLFSALSRLIDADVYFPQLADVYDRSAKGEGQTVDAGKVDEASFTDAGDNPDYSGGGGGGGGGSPNNM
jgi:hypothetical protein